jgi:hypothetical protein
VDGDLSGTAMIIRGASWCDLVKHADGRVEFVSLSGTRVECAQRWAVHAGQPLLYLRAAADGNGRVCAIGQGHVDGEAWATIDGGAPFSLGTTHGVFPVLIFGDSLGWVAFVQRTTATYDVMRLHSRGGHVRLAMREMAPTSQGFLYVASNGQPITQDQGRGAIPGLALPSPATSDPRVWVGQSMTAATLALFDGETGQIAPLHTPGGQPPHIVESGGTYYVCSYVDGGAWLSTHRRPFEPPQPPPPEDDEMNPPGVTIDKFDPVIKPGQPWKVEFHDRHNDMSARVELVNGSVHVLIRNSKGEDRSGARRSVDVRCEDGPVIIDPPPPPPPSPPPPPPVGDLDRIDGQLQTEAGGGFVVNGRPVLPILCHFGDALSRWSRGQQAAVAADLDDIAAAGYHGIRFWSTLGGDSDYWRGRGVGPIETPDYWSHVQAFLEALRDRGLVCQFSLGDTRRVVVPDLRDFAYRAGDTINAVGSHVVALGLEVNEDRDTGHLGAAKVAELNRWFREKCPHVLVGLSAFTGTEDVAILNDYSRAPADVFVCHGYRGGHWWDKTRHIFSLVYEGKPSKRLGWQGEPAGPGARVSAIDNKHELDADALCAMAAMSLLTRQAWVYFSGPGVISDEGERLQDMPGFREVPRVRTLIPTDVMRYDEVFHGGETWRQKRIFEAQGEVRADHAYYRDGRFVCLIYGPGSLDVPQTRGARIDVDHRFGDKARLIVGQA